jgi:predicted metal-binding membrane protein
MVHVVEERAFLGAAALLFIVSAVVTIAWCASMSAMGEMPMPGGWTMSMAWMRMPGQTWLDVTASFVGMWISMMVAMMLPSLVPTLRRFRRAVGGGGRRLGWLTLAAGTGYFSVWAAIGGVVFAAGAVLAAFEMQQPAFARAVPLIAGLIVSSAGAAQCTAWKAHYLSTCREASERVASSQTDARAAWQYGLHVGVQCVCCCAGSMLTLLVFGVMNLCTMTVVAVAITLERLATSGVRVARAVGVVLVGAGALLVARALGVG